jgi:hypothetical protein
MKDFMRKSSMSQHFLQCLWVANQLDNLQHGVSEKVHDFAQ